MALDDSTSEDEEEEGSDMASDLEGKEDDGKMNRNLLPFDLMFLQSSAGPC